MGNTVYVVQFVPWAHPPKDRKGQERARKDRKEEERRRKWQGRIQGGGGKGAADLINVIILGSW